jgi:MYXO-CTERM domain-containing protein
MELDAWRAINTGIDNLRTAPIAAPVPELETYAMLLAGLGLLGAFSRRFRRPNRPFWYIESGGSCPVFY